MDDRFLGGIRDFIMGRHSLIPRIASLMVLAALAAPSFAQEADKPQGILPVPDYSGDFSTRGYLTGDWGGGEPRWQTKASKSTPSTINIFKTSRMAVPTMKMNLDRAAGATIDLMWT
jgi:hypothetical protein